MTITPRQLNIPDNKCTHNIASCSSADIQSDSGDLIARNIIEDDKPGYNFLEIYYYVEAPAAATTTPLITLYKEYDNGEFATDNLSDASSWQYQIWCKGNTLPTTPRTYLAASVTTDPEFIEVVYVGSGRIGIALSQCADTTRIKIGVKRVPGQFAR